MEFYIIVICLAFVNARVKVHESDFKCIRGIKYREEEIWNGGQRTYNLAIDDKTNSLFFIFDINSNVNRTGYLNLETKEFGLVTGIDEGFANAVNRKSHEVYMGGTEGLYTFDYNTKSASKINGIPKENIWQMFYKNGLYFTTYSNEKALLYKNNRIEEIPELKGTVIQIGVKNNGDYVYFNDSGVFIYDKVLAKAINIGDYEINGITADISGNLYLSSPNGIFYIGDASNELENLFTSHSNIYGVAVDGDGNIIYTKEDSIVRLKPSNQECKYELVNS